MNRNKLANVFANEICRNQSIQGKCVIASEIKRVTNCLSRKMSIILIKPF